MSEQEGNASACSEKPHARNGTVFSRNETSPLHSGFNNLGHYGLIGNDAVDRFELYTKRWFVLLAFALLNLSNGWLWMTWSPLSALIADFWHVKEGQVDALSGIFMYVFVPTSFFSMWLVVNHLGLSKGLVLGAVLNCLGSAVRLLGASTYEVVYAGTFICALAQTFILPALPLLSGNWFGAQERATATSLGVLAHETGVAIGLGCTIVVEFRTSIRLNDNTLQPSALLDADVLANYLKLQLGVALLALLLILATSTTDRPPTPPSAAAANLRQGNITNSASDSIQKSQGYSYKESVRLIYTNATSIAFFAVFGLSVGVYYAIPTFLSQFVPFWPPSDRGWLGGIFQLSAMVGCFVAGKVGDKFHQHYRMICLMLLSGTVCSLVLFMMAVSSSQETVSCLAMVACGLTGLLLAAFVPVGIEFGTALTYPADEGAVYGVLDCTAELSGFLLVTVGGAINVGMGYIGGLLGVLSTSLLILWCIQGNTKRPQ